VAKTDLQHGGGYTYQWQCAILLALDYFFEPVSYDDTLHGLVTSFGQLETMLLEEGDPLGSEGGLEDINLLVGKPGAATEKRILIQAKTRESGQWVPGDEALRKALYRFYQNTSLNQDDSKVHFVFLSNRQFGEKLDILAKAIEQGKVAECPTTGLLYEDVCRYAGQKEGEKDQDGNAWKDLDKGRFVRMLSRTALVDFLDLDQVTANVHAKLQAYGRLDWEVAYDRLFSRFAKLSTQKGGGRVTPALMTEILGPAVKVGTAPTAEFVPPLPNHYVERGFVDELMARVRETKGRYVGVFGFSGTGKSVLVSGLIQKYADELHTTFPGGIYWILGTGHGADDPRKHCQSQAYRELPEANPDGLNAKTWEEGLRQLQGLFTKSLGGARWLMIVDNPPDEADVFPALQFSDNGMWLVITNNRQVLDAKGIPEESILEVQQMDTDEAQELLTHWTARSPGARIVPAEAAEVAKRLGYHPLALAMAGAAVRRSVSPQDAWQDLLEALKAEEIAEISHPVDDYPIRQLPLVFKAVVDSLTVDLQETFPDLAVFPQDTGFALKEFYCLWAPEEERRIRRRVQSLLDRSLLQRIRQDTFSLHSLLRLYLRCSAEGLAQRCRRVVSTMYPGWPPIFLAAEWRDLHEVEALIQAGEDVDATSPDGATALHLAAQQGYLEIVAALAGAGAQIDRMFADGRTALELAAQNGHVETVRVLLDHGADPNGQNEEGVAPLHSAAQRGHLDVVSLLLSRGAESNLANQGRKSALYVAVGAGHAAIVQELLRHTPLADQETDPLETPLRMASRRGNAQIVRLLIDAGADANWANPNDGGTALHLASEAGQAVAVETLIRAGAMLDNRGRDGFAPLHGAAQNGHLDAVRVLLEAGAPVNASSSGGHTPLHSAAQGGHAAVVKALIEAGAVVNQQNAAL